MTPIIPIDTIEAWQPVPSLPHIWASSKGRLCYMGEPRRRMKMGHIIPQQTGPLGYKRANIPLDASGPARNKMMQVHRLIASAFFGPPRLTGERMVVAHLDDDPGNNDFTNLRWMTQRDNLAAEGCRAKMRAKNSGPNHPMYGKKLSAETRAKMSAAAMGNTRRADGLRRKLQHPIRQRDASANTQDSEVGVKNF